MAGINFQAFIDQHKRDTLALIGKVKQIYDGNYSLFSGYISFQIRDPIDAGIRTNVVLISRSDEITLLNTVIVVVRVVGSRGILETRWQDGVTETVQSGTLLVDEYIQSINEMKAMVTLMTSINDFPPYVIGDTPPLPPAGALQDEENDYVLDENYQMLELE